MKFSDAVKLMENGRKVTKKSWYNNMYIWKNDIGGISRSTGPDAPIFNGDTFGDDWIEYKNKVNIKDIREGELFEFSGETYRRVPDYMIEYSPIIPNNFTVAAARHKHKGYTNGEITVFTPDCLVYKL